MDSNRSCDIDKIKKGGGFTLGLATGFFKEVGPYSILPYHPWKSDGSLVFSGQADMDETSYHLWIDGRDARQSFSSLDAALAGGIAYRAEGPNHKADRYFMLAIKAIETEKKVTP